MTYLIIALLALAVVAASTGLLARIRGEQESPIVEGSSCNTCTGINTKCEQECMMEAATHEIEYYDDEELDAYRGRPSDSYTDDEVEEFSEVLYTMKPQEVKGWNRSLTLRGINIPDQLKDELIAFL